MVMHPGPINRGVEIASISRGWCASSVIHEQVEMGVAVRSAVLEAVARHLAEHSEVDAHGRYPQASLRKPERRLKPGDLGEPKIFINARLVDPASAARRSRAVSWFETDVIADRGRHTSGSTRRTAWR